MNLLITQFSKWFLASRRMHRGNRFEFGRFEFNIDASHNGISHCAHWPKQINCERYHSFLFYIFHSYCWRCWNSTLRMHETETQFETEFHAYTLLFSNILWTVNCMNINNNNTGDRSTKELDRMNECVRALFFYSIWVEIRFFVAYCIFVPKKMNTPEPNVWMKRENNKVNWQ